MKPAWAKELEKRIGLRCRTSFRRDDYWEGDVMSPSQFVLFRIGGYDNLGLGMVTMPIMKDLQGKT